MANFCAFGLKPNVDWNLLRKFCNLHIKISMEAWLFIHFLFHFQDHCHFIQLLKITSFFYNIFFGFGGGEGELPHSFLRAPQEIGAKLYVGNAPFQGLEGFSDFLDHRIANKFLSFFALVIFHLKIFILFAISHNSSVLLKKC